LVEFGVNKVKSIYGCSDDQVSYELADGTNENPLNPSDTTCFVFDDNGGGVTACGSYLDPLVVTGNITAVGDTSTIVLMASGAYFRCASWSSSDCVPEHSVDGVSFVDNTELCIFKDDGSDADRGPFAAAIAASFADAMCASACSGTGIGTYRTAPGAVEFYLEDDYSLSAYTGTCDRSLRDFECSCW
jgi:hypothetical protein